MRRLWTRRLCHIWLHWVPDRKGWHCGAPQLQQQCPKSRIGAEIEAADSRSTRRPVCIACRMQLDWSSGAIFGRHRSLQFASPIAASRFARQQSVFLNATFFKLGKNISGVKKLFVKYYQSKKKKLPSKRYNLHNVWSMFEYPVQQHCSRSRSRAAC